MKVPNVFKPEKNLEYKTESLLNEEPKPKTEEVFKPPVEKSELEKVLYLFDTFSSSSYSQDNLHIKIEELIEKSDYKPLNFKKLRYKYWSRSSYYSTEIKRVFIKEDIYTNRDTYYSYYSFATVKKDKLEEFCKRFDKVQSRALMPDYKFAKHIISGVFTGGAAELAFQYALLPIKLLDSLTIPLFVLGAVTGACAGFISYIYTGPRDKRKLRNCHTQIIINNRKAVEEAFS